MRTLIAFLAFAPATFAGQPDPMIERVENGLLPIAAFALGKVATIDERMRDYGVPGISIAVIDKGRLAWAKAYGVIDAVSGRRVTPATRFQGASISKPVSAMGALLLVQKGLLSVDGDVNDKLLSWRIPASSVARSAITLRMLMNHSSGLAHSNSEGGTPFAVGDKLPTIVETLMGAPPARGGPVLIATPPGERFEYSAAGYEALQQLVEEVSGKPFEEYMRRELFVPLKMASSTFQQPLPKNLVAVAATGHYAGGRPLPGRFRVSPELTVAGLWTTPSDLARYIVSVQRAYAGSSKELLTIDMAREMLRPDANRRGLGPALSGAGESMRFGHDGFNEGFEASFTAYVQEGRGAVVMANSGFAFMLIKEIMDSVARAYAWPEFGPTAQQPPSASLQPQQIVVMPKAVLDVASGFYAAEGWISLRLHASGGHLLLDWPDFGTAEIFATPDGRFLCPPLTFSDVGSPWLQLVRGPTGVIDSIRAADDGSVEFRRMTD